MAGLADLSKKGPVVHVGLVVGAALFLGVLYWQFYYTGVTEELEQQKQHNAGLQQTNADLKKQKETWEELSLQKDRLDERSKKNQVSLPAAAELPAFFGHMQKQMAASGVQLRSWKRETEIPIENYVKVPVSIRLTGTFYQLNNYFYLLYQTDRIVTVENLSLTRGNSNTGELTLSASFTASTFRQADGPAEVEPEEETTAVEKVKAVNEKSGKAIEAATGDKAAPSGPNKTNPNGNAKAGVDRVKQP